MALKDVISSTKQALAERLQWEEKKQQEAQRQRDIRDREAARKIIEGLEERVRDAVNAGDDSIRVMGLGDSTNDIAGLKGGGLIVYNHIVGEGLGDKCFVDLDCSGNLGPADNQLVLRLV